MAAIAKVVSVATFIALWATLIRDQKLASLTVFATIFLFGVATQRMGFFWKACLAFFGLMSVLYIFAVFGGLEPNSPWILAGAEDMYAKLAVFLLLVLSTTLSLIAGLRTIGPSHQQNRWPS
ncbi:hypothetical protein [Stenotrophomonas oahuensis]|uniref:Transmembrane protein n=1 Tax=Stenotrophomonas oahuensis TaxID=3003271 RepID=A0ABY9YSZ3_9GAMM|nr:hypothetical protein [Stenotrophomonas sp. A5586]WNH54064.1 hypothetical protein PDM29_07240 [Stenotrophomonas sp. A5586]